MIIKKYGITLVRLKKEHLELVRQKRNLAYIQDKMVYKKKISRWQQRRWFKKVNNKYNFYFLIEYQNKFIGLINGKDLNFETMSVEGGIFLWEIEYWNTHIPVMASIILNDCNFFLSKFKINYAKILKSNSKAIKYNLNLGYQIIEERSDGVIILQLTQENYSKKIIKIRKGIEVLTGDKKPLSVLDFSLSDETKKDIKRLYTNLPSDFQDFINQIKR